jgi:hypothetical protein
MNGDADEVALSKLRHVMDKIETIAVENVERLPNVTAMEAEVISFGSAMRSCTKAVVVSVSECCRS